MPGASAVVFTGPLMGIAEFEELQMHAAEWTGIVVRDFVPDLRPYLDVADVVVSMCGYNQAAEVVYQKAKAIVVPRTWQYGQHAKRACAGEEWEQLMRGQVLEARGLVDLIKPQDLSPGELAKRIWIALEREPVDTDTPMDFTGVDTAVDQILELAGCGGGNIDVSK